MNMPEKENDKSSEPLSQNVSRSTDSMSEAETRTPARDDSSSSSVLDIVKTRFRDLYEDAKVKPFIPLKINNFLLFGAMTTLYPFLTIQAKTLGITESELGLIYGVMPVISTIGPPISGMLADKVGNFKYLLSGIMALSGASALLFMTVPIGRIEHPMPESLPVRLFCVGDTVSLSVLSNHTCEFSTDWWSNLPCSSHCIEVASLTASLYKLNQSHTEPNCTTGFFSRGNDCKSSCVLIIPTKTLCTNEVTMEEINPTLTFWLYTLFRSLNSVTLSMSMPMFEGATVSIIRQYNGDFGFQRLYGIFGPIVMTPLAGMLIDTMSENAGAPDYRASFYIYFVITLLVSVLILFLDLEFKMASNTVLKDFVKIITNAEIVIFLLMMLFAGLCFGAVETFLFWLLDDIGASKQLMGLTLTVGNICGIPILIFATPIIEKLGCANTIVVGFCVYAFRFVGYSVIYNPWLCMPFEALECFTLALLTTAAVTFATDLSTLKTRATLQSITGGFHYGVGRGLGSLITGFIMAAIGIRAMFQTMAGVAICCAVFYFVVNRLCFRSAAERRDAQKRREKLQPQVKEKAGNANLLRGSEKTPEV